MSKININGKIRYYNDKIELHRIGMFACKIYGTKFWYFNGEDHRINGKPNIWDCKYALYGRQINLNIEKLVI